MKMSIRSRHMVKPAEATFKGDFPLSELDQISVVTLSSHLYFYDKPTQEKWLNPSTNIMHTLKESLNRVLVPFYPLAGRLSWIGGGRLKLECNTMGAELIEVESTMKITDFGDFFSAKKKFQQLLPVIDYYRKPIHELPVLAVQITRFSCGGLGLGISMSHVVVDGRSAFHFTNEWARLALGEPIEVAPFLDRRVLQQAQVNHVNASLLEGIFNDEQVNYFSQLRLNESINWGKQVTPTFVVLKKDIIERLKEVANSNRHILGKGARPYSRFEVIEAYVWRCVCKARELKEEDMTILTVLVDAHDRMEPPLPSSFFGNAIVDVETTSIAGTLLSNSLSYACDIIRKTIKKVNKDYILENINFFKNQKSLTKYQYLDDRGIMEGPAYGNNNVQIVSWLNLASRARGIDFGWGKEIHMGPPIVQTCDGDIQLSPYKNDGSVVVAVCLQQKEKFLDCTSSAISVNI